MIVIRNISELGKDVHLAATIGFFDGVHAGHRFLIDDLKKTAKEFNLASAIITFAEQPRSVLNKEYKARLLNTFDEKLKYLESTGIDYCIILDFTLELSKLSARRFMHDILFQQMHIELLIIGYDHRFGRNREESFRDYVDYGAQYGLKVIKAPQFKEENQNVSSSEIRQLLQHCRIERANELLTYPYTLHGHVVRGHQVGRQLGYPTANISVDDHRKIIPAIGVYAVLVKVEGDEREYGGMLYIGKRPTLENGLNTTVEVNIFDFEEDIYNKEITVIFIKFLRGDAKFESLVDLKNQLRKDYDDVHLVLENKMKKGL